jgi:hypothetical protein
MTRSIPTNPLFRIGWWLLAMALALCGILWVTGQRDMLDGLIVLIKNNCSTPTF